MPSTATNRLQGLTTSVAVKPPCITVATTNITLSGLQTISTVTVVEGDRVLVKGQSTASENGIYNASTGSWTRALDFDGDLDAVSGTRILVRSAGSNGVEYELTTADPIVIGTTSLVFTLRYGANATYDQTEAEIAAGVTPVSYANSELDTFRYSVGNASTVNWASVYAEIDSFDRLDVMERRLGPVRPEWFAPNGQIISGVTDASPYIQAAITFLETRNLQGVSATSYAKGVLLFDAKVYLCKSTITFRSFINYEGMRSTTPNSQADFGDLSYSRGTVLRAHTDIYNDDNDTAGVMIYIPTGDMTISKICFVGTAMMTVNPCIGIQFGSTGGVANSGRPHETDGTGSVASGMYIEGCTWNSFTRVWECNWIEDSFFYQPRFENSTNNIVTVGNSQHDTKVQFELFGCIGYNHTQNFAVSSQPTGRTVSVNVKMVGGYLYSILDNATHWAVQTTAANATPVQLHIELVGVHMTHTGASCRHFLFNANWDSVDMRLKVSGGWLTGATSLFGLNGGTTKPNNLEFHAFDITNSVMTFDEAKMIRLIGGVVTNSVLTFDTADNWITESQSFRNLAAGSNAITVLAGCANGQIVRPSFDGVTDRILITSGSTNSSIQVIDPIGYITTPADGTIHNLNPGVLFAALGTPANGSIVYCSNGTAANPVASGGTGCIAKRINGVWVGT